LIDNLIDYMPKSLLYVPPHTTIHL